MKYTAIAALLAIAASTTAASPVEIEARTGTPAPSCSNTQKQVCCNGILDCVVQVLGTTCTGQAYCCDTSAGTGSLVNFQALNCIQVL